jgi:hypothetical protein
VKVDRITKKQARRAALAKLPIYGDKALQKNLEMMLGECARCSPSMSLAEAYRIGADEAQRIIARRLDALKTQTRSASATDAASELL